MRKVVALLVAAAAALAAFGVAQAAQSGASKRTAICHRTKSNAAGKAYKRLLVSKAVLRGHRRHAADIIPAPARCPRLALTPTQGGTELTATMTGVAEVPLGDPDGTGTASIRLIRNAGIACFTLTVRNIQLPATASHIHKAPLGQAGAVVIPLTPAPDANGSSKGCVPVVTEGKVDRALVNAILATASDYYVNVHTNDHPAGAVRGQLSG
jgi:CHRD domain